MAIYTISGGIVSSGVTLGRFDEMNVLAGGTATATTVAASADLYVHSGAVAFGSLIGSGGGVFVIGEAVTNTVNGGGYEYVLGGAADFSRVNGGAIERWAPAGPLTARN